MRGKMDNRINVTSDSRGPSTHYWDVDVCEQRKQKMKSTMDIWEAGVEGWLQWMVAAIFMASHKTAYEAGTEGSAQIKSNTAGLVMAAFILLKSRRQCMR